MNDDEKLLNMMKNAVIDAQNDAQKRQHAKKLKAKVSFTILVCIACADYAYLIYLGNNPMPAVIFGAVAGTAMVFATVCEWTQPKFWR